MAKTNGVPSVVADSSVCSRQRATKVGKLPQGPFVYPNPGRRKVLKRMSVVKYPQGPVIPLIYLVGWWGMAKVGC